MGKRSGFLIIFVFFTCLVMGFLTNRFLFQKNQSLDSTRPTPTPLPTLPHQRNMLLIITDDLSSPTLAVKSLWALILYFPQQQLIFQALPLPESQSDFPRNFNLGADGTLTRDFLQRASQAYNLPWQDYFILDGEALNNLYRWASQEYQIGSEAKPSDEQVFLGVCDSISQSPNALFALIDSGILQAPHFRSSITLDIATEIRNNFSPSTTSIKCNVYGH
jgi:hypothetical protein